MKYHFTRRGIIFRTPQGVTRYISWQENMLILYSEDKHCLYIECQPQDIYCPMSEKEYNVFIEDLMCQ